MTIEVHCVSALARLLHFLPINFTHHIIEKMKLCYVSIFTTNKTKEHFGP